MALSGNREKEAEDVPVSFPQWKGFLWRTEKTYREWAARFAAFLRPCSPYAATGDDVAAFLTKLAVEQRASASTQIYTHVMQRPGLGVRSPLDG